VSLWRAVYAQLWDLDVLATSCPPPSSPFPPCSSHLAHVSALPPASSSVSTEEEAVNTICSGGHGIEGGGKGGEGVEGGEGDGSGVRAVLCAPKDAMYIDTHKVPQAQVRWVLGEVVRHTGVARLVYPSSAMIKGFKSAGLALQTLTPRCAIRERQASYTLASNVL
jgi:hypothetical protein